MNVISKFLNWVDSLIYKIMSKQSPRQTTPEETKEVLKKKAEYEKWAKEGK